MEIDEAGCEDMRCGTCAIDMRIGGNVAREVARWFVCKDVVAAWEVSQLLGPSFRARFMTML